MDTPITEGDAVRVLRLADQAVKSLEAEINNWPKALVWSCKSRDEISRLKIHYEQCIEDYTKRLPGSGHGRQMLLALIDSAERELRACDEIMGLIGG